MRLIVLNKTRKAEEKQLQIERQEQARLDQKKMRDEEKQRKKDEDTQAKKEEHRKKRKRNNQSKARVAQSLRRGTNSNRTSFHTAIRRLFRGMMFCLFLRPGDRPVIEGPEAAKRIIGSEFHEQKLVVDETDFIGVKKGAEVEVWPLDDHSGHKTREVGELVGLTHQEAVIEKNTQHGETRVRVHLPRWN
jgi:hypothetical protein